MSERTKAKFKVGDRCYCKHPYAFRSEAPFTIVGITLLLIPSERKRYCYIVQYDDGVLDAIPVLNEGGYQMELCSCPKSK